MNIIQKLKQAIKNPLDVIWYITGINICYAQNWEDLILRGLTTEKSDWFYVDIWANDPVHFNNTYMLYKKWWRWINVEPNKKLINKFKSKRPKDQNLQLACWDSWQSPLLIFYNFEPNTLSTCDEITAKKYEKMWHKLISSYSVPVMWLSEIIEKYWSGKEIDILSVDVEWHDLNVLKTNNREKYRPQYVILETLEYKNDYSGKKLNQLYDPLFTQRWYEKFADTHINTIYKRKI